MAGYPFDSYSRYHTKARLGPEFPTPDSTLINGIGRFVGGPSVALAVVNVVKDVSYRFRVISLSCGAFPVCLPSALVHKVLQIQILSFLLTAINLL